MGKDASSKITYVTLTADNQELHAQFDAAIARVRAGAGRTLPIYIGGRPRTIAATTESRNPADTRMLVARAASGSPTDVADAVAAAAAAFPAWRRTPWPERADVLARPPPARRERRLQLATRLLLPTGKNPRE